MIRSSDIATISLTAWVRAELRRRPVTLHLPAEDDVLARLGPAVMSLAPAMGRAWTGLWRSLAELAGRKPPESRPGAPSPDPDALHDLLVGGGWTVRKGLSVPLFRTRLGREFAAVAEADPGPWSTGDVVRSLGELWRVAAGQADPGAALAGEVRRRLEGLATELEAAGVGLVAGFLSIDTMGSGGSSDEVMGAVLRMRLTDEAAGDPSLQPLIVSDPADAKWWALWGRGPAAPKPAGPASGTVEAARAGLTPPPPPGGFAPPGYGPPPTGAWGGQPGYGPQGFGPQGWGPQGYGPQGYGHPGAWGGPPPQWGQVPPWWGAPGMGAGGVPPWGPPQWGPWGGQGPMYQPPTPGGETIAPPQPLAPSPNALPSLPPQQAPTMPASPGFGGPPTFGQPGPAGAPGQSADQTGTRPAPQPGLTSQPDPAAQPGQPGGPVPPWQAGWPGGWGAPGSRFGAWGAPAAPPQWGQPTGYGYAAGPAGPWMPPRLQLAPNPAMPRPPSRADWITSVGGADSPAAKPGTVKVAFRPAGVILAVLAATALATLVGMRIAIQAAAQRTHSADPATTSAAPTGTGSSGTGSPVTSPNPGTARIGPDGKTPTKPGPAGWQRDPRDPFRPLSSREKFQQRRVNLGDEDPDR